MNLNMDSVQSWKFPGWDIGLRCILFGLAMLSTVSCSNNTTTVERESTTYNTTVNFTNINKASEMTTQSILSSTAYETTSTKDTNTIDPITTLSIASSLLAILIMISVCVWILAYMRKRGREHNMAWSPPPINVHLHGVGSHSLSRTPSHYRSHRTMSENDQDQPPAENKSSGHMYNVIDNCAPGQTQVDNTGLPTMDGKRPKGDDGVNSEEISGKVSDPFPMIPNPLYRTTSCMMERRGPMPLPPVGHRSIGHNPRKSPPQERYVPTRDNEPLEAKTRAISGKGCSGNQPDSAIHSVRSKSCDPLRIPDQPTKETSDQPQWSLLDSLDTFERRGGLDTPSLNDVFGEPEYSLIENPSGRPRSYSLFHLPTKSSFGQGPNQAFEMVSRRNRARTSCSKELSGSSLAQTPERYEMFENPLYPSSSYNLLDCSEKRRTRKRETEGGCLGSSSNEKKSSQRGIDDEGDQTISDPGGEHCRVDIGYKDLK